MLSVTPPYFDYNWTVRPGLDAALTKKLTDAFLKLDPAKPEMKEIMDLQRALEVHPDAELELRRHRGGGEVGRAAQVGESQRAGHDDREPVARRRRPRFIRTATAPCTGSRWRSRGGERVAVIGPSGAGKTTLIRVLGTALQADRRPASSSLGSDPWQLGAGGAARAARADRRRPPEPADSAAAARRHRRARRPARHLADLEGARLAAAAGRRRRRARRARPARPRRSRCSTAAIASPAASCSASASPACCTSGPT